MQSSGGRFHPQTAPVPPTDRFHPHLSQDRRVFRKGPRPKVSAKARSVFQKSPEAFAKPPPPPITASTRRETPRRKKGGHGPGGRETDNKLTSKLLPLTTSHWEDAMGAPPFLRRKSSS